MGIFVERERVSLVLLVGTGFHDVEEVALILYLVVNRGANVSTIVCYTVVANIVRSILEANKEEGDLSNIIKNYHKNPILTVFS
jgi:hypothetical protein